MKVEYQYKGKVFEDIRDIVFNNDLKMDQETILREYLPFQIFITGRTFFEGVTVKPTVRFDPNHWISRGEFTEDVFSYGVERYLYYYGFYDYKRPIAAVSGGIDSSTVALQLRPELIYSGYYEEDEYDETRYSSEIASTIGAKHYKIKLIEDDFFDCLYEFIDAVCTPAGGLGGIMEVAILKNVLKEIDADAIVFGQGGDEIFMGYFFNHFIKNFYDRAGDTLKYMPNFAPSERKVTRSLIDPMVVMSINRSPENILCSPFVIQNIFPMLASIDDVVSKLLYVNINFTLPTLLHLCCQMCKFLEVRAFNPLANSWFIAAARAINEPMTVVPKQVLRDVHPDMPEMVKKNYFKRGFPIPTEKWTRLDYEMKEAYDKFFGRPWVDIEKKPYDGINRWTWGVFQAELFLRRFG